MLTHQVGDKPQHGIPRQMAIGIVEEFESVQIHQHHAEPFAGALGVGERIR
ncbi:hypothetical protein GALL_485300 [mine drainage metagenome]|uniref:Uncharacterized protein n=1 Tax=mine drainage metagenome TaxID=410659 RepID=A0A1J5PGG2_9ZZZZ